MASSVFNIAVAILCACCGWVGLKILTPLCIDREKGVGPPEYVYSVDDDTVIPLPFVTLRGTLIRHTFPGVPNYESIENGDAPEPRWVLVVPEEELRRLTASRYVPKDMYDSCLEGWIQLIAVGTEESPQPFLNKRIVVKGYLGTLVSHIHTLVTIEAKEIYEDAQKVD